MLTSSLHRQRELSKQTELSLKRKFCSLLEGGNAAGNHEIRQKIYVDLMSTLMPYLRQASLHIPCNYGEVVSYGTNYGMSACMYQMYQMESHFAITKRT